MYWFLFVLSILKIAVPEEHDSTIVNEKVNAMHRFFN